MVIIAVCGVSGERMHELSAATESATKSATKHDQRQPGPAWHTQCPSKNFNSRCLIYRAYLAWYSCYQLRLASVDARAHRPRGKHPKDDAPWEIVRTTLSTLRVSDVSILAMAT